MTPSDLRDLLRPYKHAFHFGGLVSAAHPTFEARIGAATRTGPGQRRGKIADRKPNPGVIGIKRGDDDLSNITLRYWLTGPRPHDFEDQVLVDDHAFAGVGFIGDQAEIGGAERLVRIDATRPDLFLQRLRKCSTGNRCTFNRTAIPTGTRTRIEQDFEKIR